jgi:hypothetical protein
MLASPGSVPYEPKGRELGGRPWAGFIVLRCRLRVNGNGDDRIVRALVVTWSGTDWRRG